MLYITYIAVLLSVVILPADSVVNNNTQESESIHAINEDFVSNAQIYDKKSKNTSTAHHNNKNKNKYKYKSYDVDSLYIYLKNYNINKTRVFPEHPDNSSIDKTPDHSYMSPLFMPLVFNSIPRKFNLKPKEKTGALNLIGYQLQDSIIRELEAKEHVRNLTNEILLKAEAQNIKLIQYTQEDLPEPEQMIFQLNGGKPIIRSGLRFKLSERPVDTKVLPRTKYNPWSKKGNAKLQFSQTYISPNWSNGGESNMAGLASFYLEANYYDLKNVQFDNNFEVKVGLNTVSSDSLRNFNISTDQIRAVSKLGVKMYNDWYYSLSSEFLTQMMDKYEKNTTKLKSSLFSPAKLYISLGIDYKKSDKKKGYALSVMLSPLTYKLNYLYDIENFNESSYGIDVGKHIGQEIGSKVSSTLSWKLNNQVNWNSKFYYYTDFTYVDSEWENTMDFNLSNNISTQIFLHLKADDRLERDPGEPLIQIQELLSFGLVYRW